LLDENGDDDQEAVEIFKAFDGSVRALLDVVPSVHR
jgi:hypothetical protein